MLAPGSARGGSVGPAGEHHQQSRLRQSAGVHARWQRHPVHLDSRRHADRHLSLRRRVGSTTRVTNTPESEYSPTVTPDGAHISVIRVEADGTQRLWRFTIDGRVAGTGADRRQAGRLPRVGRRSHARAVRARVAGDAAARRHAERARRDAGDRHQPFDSAHSRRRHDQLRRASGGAGGAARTLSIRELDPKTARITPLVNAVAGAREADLRLDAGRHAGDGGEGRVVRMAARRRRRGGASRTSRRSGCTASRGSRSARRAIASRSSRSHNGERRNRKGRREDREDRSLRSLRSLRSFLGRQSSASVM